MKQSYTTSRRRLTALILLVTVFSGSPLHAQRKNIFDKIQDKIDKAEGTYLSAKKLQDRLDYLSDISSLSPDEFNERIVVSRGRKGSGPAYDAGSVSGAINTPKFSGGKFTNITWKPAVYFEDQLFPSSIICLSNYTGEQDGFTEFMGRPLGFQLTAKNDNVPLRYEIECSDKKYFKKAKGTLFCPKAGQETCFMPDVSWNYEVLSKHQSSAPISVTFRILDEKGHAEEVVRKLYVRSISDCIWEYKKRDLKFMYTAYIQEEHPEIDKILREALNTKMIKSVHGYQGSEEETHMQVAAIWRVLHDRGFQYSDITETPLPFGSKGLYHQTVRTFDDAIKTQQANCVDGTVVFASILRRIGISTVMVLVPGHCFLGYRATEDKNAKMYYVETTLLSSSSALAKAKPGKENSAYKEQYMQALASGSKTFQKAKSGNKRIITIDVNKMRETVQPIPFYTN